MLHILISARDLILQHPHMGSADVGLKKGGPAVVVGCVNAEGEDGGDGRESARGSSKVNFHPFCLPPF